MCLNFVDNGTCSVTGKECILGAHGADSKNEAHECGLQGDYDVWVMHDGVLVTDLGIPSKEPVQCLALGVNEQVAVAVASARSKLTAKPLQTSKRKCVRCGTLYWVSEHKRAHGLVTYGYGTFCPRCFGPEHLEIGKSCSEVHYWCG